MTALEGSPQLNALCGNSRVFGYQVETQVFQRPTLLFAGDSHHSKLTALPVKSHQL